MNIPTNKIHFIFEESQINKNQSFFINTTDTMELLQPKNLRFIGTILEG